MLKWKDTECFYIDLTKCKQITLRQVQDKCKRKQDRKKRFPKTVNVLSLPRMS